MDYLKQAEPKQPEPLRVENWTILCPGPSLEGFKPEDALEGPVIAVNEAIGLIDSPDVWGLTKIPAEINPALEDYGLSVSAVAGNHEQRIWTRSSVKKVALGDRVDRTFPSRKPALERFMGVATRTEWSQAPWLGLVAIAITLGAKHIRVIGADMKGHGYAGIPNGPFGYRDEPDTDDVRRWRMEQRVVEMAVADAKNAGVTIEVVGMKGAETLRKPARKDPEPVAAAASESGVSKSKPASAGRQTKLGDPDE